jgi:four helix bundle protein
VASFVHVLPGMRREIHERAFRLALRVARLRRDPPYARMVREVVLRQMIRSAASIGANLEEATAAQSRADFASKVAIATKEAREMQYWLRLGHEAGLLREEEWLTLGPEAREVAQVVSAIARSASRPPGSKRS